MLEVFTRLADWLVYGVAGMASGEKLGNALHFFVEDVTKIYFLLVVMIYVVAWLRASLRVERVRDYLSGRHRFLGYVFGSGFGAVTPFCSCSSIPVFMGFTAAGIPLGVTMAFLLTSPLINEVAVVMLVSMVGWKVTLLYVVTGMLVGILGGMFLDALRAERWLSDLALRARGAGVVVADRQGAMTWTQRHEFALGELKEIFSRVWIWVIVGVGLGAGLHGFVPDGWFAEHLGQGQWWSVPAAVLVGIPLYSNATGVIPVMESLIAKGLPLGTTLAFCMSTVAASFPEFVMLKQVMTWRLLMLVFLLLLVSFTLVGWLINLFAPML